jgi:HEAT repeat protein
MSHLRFLIPLLVLWLGFLTACTGAGGSEGGVREAQLPDDIPGLIDLLTRPNEPNQAQIMEKLVAKGDEAIEPLLGALGKDGIEQAGVEHALARIGKPAVPGLIQALRNDDHWVRMGAIITLGMIGPDAAEAAEPLVNLFSGTLKVEQIQIMYTLADVSPTEDVIGMVRAAMMVDDLRYYAMRVLGKIGPGAASAVPAILLYLNHQDSQARIEAMLALKSIGPVEGVVDGIAGRLADEDERVRLNAAQALGDLGKDAVGATMQLATALSDQDADVQRAAARSLGLMAPESRAAIPALVRALSVESAQTRREVALTLGLFGSEASSALSRLREVSENDQVDYVRNAAARAIESIENPPQEDAG